MSKISIIIPNFNKDLFIKETLDSIKSQSFENWECIIVDDGSNDNSINIISDFVKQDNRFLLIQRTIEPKGGSVCRNIGLEKATGEFVVFFDSDDLMLPHFLKHRFEKINASPFIDFAVFSCGTFADKIGDSKLVWKVRKGNHLNQFLRFDLPWNIMSPIWRKKFLLKLGGFDSKFPLLQDGEMHTRALLTSNVSYEVYPDLEPDCFYRISFSRKGHDMTTQLNLHLRGALMYIDKMTEILINENKNHKLKHLKGTAFALINRIMWLSSQQKIKSGEFDSILAEFLEEMNTRTIVFRNGHNRFLNIYMKLFKIGFYRLKGFNYISKLIYIYF